MPIKEVHKAIAFAERQLDIDRLLLSRQLTTHAGELFLEQYGKLIRLSASGQIAMRQMLDAHLRRVEWDQRDIPVRLFPFLVAVTTDDERPISIDPAVAFGRPIVARRGVSTHAIVERIDAGESVEDLAGDYDLSPKEIEQAVVYEQAA